MQREMVRLMQEILGDVLCVAELPDAGESISLDGGSILSSEVKSKSPSVSSTSSNEDVQDSSNVGLCASTLSIETNSSGSQGSKSRSRAKSTNSTGDGGTSGGPAAQHNHHSSSPTASINSHLQHLWSHLTPAQLQNKIIISVSLSAFVPQISKSFSI